MDRTGPKTLCSRSLRTADINDAIRASSLHNSDAADNIVRFVDGVRVHPHNELAPRPQNRPIQSGGNDLPRIIDDCTPRIGPPEFSKNLPRAIRAHAVRDDDVENQIRPVQPNQTFQKSPDMGNLVPAGDDDSYVQGQQRG